MARIVIADDDDDIRELVELKLTSLGHAVTAVGDGAAAVAACRRHRPDLAILDVMMPGTTGLEALVEIRADPDLAGLPVILLTARAGHADLDAAMGSGADDYVLKPFSPRDLAARVAALIDERSGGGRDDSDRN